MISTKQNLRPSGPECGALLVLWAKLQGRVVPGTDDVTFGEEITGMMGSSKFDH